MGLYPIRLSDFRGLLLRMLSSLFYLGRIMSDLKEDAINDNKPRQPPTVSLLHGVATDKVSIKDLKR